MPTGMSISIGGTLNVAVLVTAAYVVVATRPEKPLLVSKVTLPMVRHVDVVPSLESVFGTIARFDIRSLTRESRAPVTVPRTPLGRMLLTLRDKAIREGLSLLSVLEINALVSDSRGKAG